jgi:hypothetical protein
MNMSYCRFQNTLTDLQDCYENIDDKPKSTEESKARIQLIRLCFDIAMDYSDEIGVYLQEVQT